MSVKTSHIRAMERRRSGRRPTRAGRKANPTEQAKENIWDVAVMSVWSNVVVIPTSFNIYFSSVTPVSEFPSIPQLN